MVKLVSSANMQTLNSLAKAKALRCIDNQQDGVQMKQHVT